VLRRRTDYLLSVLLGLSFLPALAGAIWTLVNEPDDRFLAGLIVGAALLLVLAVFRRGDLVMMIVVVLLLATYALAAACLYHRFGLSPRLAGLVVLGAVALIVAILLRALIASGSADYPYDD
jgi:hypothetical protein